MQDHLEVYIQYSCKQPVSMQPHLAKWKMPWIGLAMAVPQGPGGHQPLRGRRVRASSNPSERYPNLMFHFLPIAIRYDGTAPTKGHGYQVHVGPMYSESKGSVKITSTDPRTKPAIRFNYLSTEKDRREWIEAVHTTRRILNQPAFEPYRRRRDLAGSVGRDRRGDHGLGRPRLRDRPAPVVYLQDGHRRDGGRRPAARCGSTGPKGLRVVDASVLPIVTNGNLYAPTMMIAEKAADIILGVTPLPPDTAEVYLPDRPTDTPARALAPNNFVTKGRSGRLRDSPYI